MRFRFAARLVVTVIVVLALGDVLLWRAFPRLSRLSDNFSAAYLSRQVDALRATEPVVVLGDSVLWGFGIAANETAIARLASRGRPYENFAYEGGSPANTYAMVRVLLREHVRPRSVIFNVNLESFGPADSAYRRLHPAVERLASPLLSARERALLEPGTAPSLDARLAGLVESVWHAYAMRSDIRAVLFGAPDAAHAIQNAVERASGTTARRARAHRPSADRFEGTYDLSPLAPANVSIAFLERTARALRDAQIPAYAFLTPTNHALLRAFIDVPEYRAQLAYVRRLLMLGGVHVLDYDAAFPANEFIDNDHLTPAGNAHLATLLARDVPF